MKYHYVYMSSDEHRYYVGCRSCECHPFQDIDYFGSYSDKNFNPDKKKILAIFDNKKDALSHEIWLHNIYNVAKNPNFANKAKQTSNGFDTTGVKYQMSNETKEKISNTLKGRKLTEETRQKISESRQGKEPWNKGKKLSDEYKNKISESRQGIEPWNKGLKNCFSEETLNKISKARLGKEPWNKGKKFPEKSGKNHHNYGKTWGDNHPCRDKNTYLFIHKNEETFEGTRLEFYKKTGFTAGYAKIMFQTKHGQKTYKGWKVVACIL